MNLTTYNATKPPPPSAPSTDPREVGSNLNPMKDPYEEAEERRKDEPTEEG